MQCFVQAWQSRCDTVWGGGVQEKDDKGEKVFRGPRVRMGIHWAVEGTVANRSFTALQPCPALLALPCPAWPCPALPAVSFVDCPFLECHCVHYIASCPVAVHFIAAV